MNRLRDTWLVRHEECLLCAHGETDPHDPVTCVCCLGAGHVDFPCPCGCPDGAFATTSTEENLIMTQLATYAKAIVGAIVAGLGAVATALEDGSVSQQEGIFAAIAFLTALGIVWAVPNAQPPDEA